MCLCEEHCAYINRTLRTRGVVILILNQKINCNEKLDSLIVKLKSRSGDSSSIFIVFTATWLCVSEENNTSKMTPLAYHTLQLHSQTLQHHHHHNNQLSSIGGDTSSVGYVGFIFYFSFIDLFGKGGLLWTDMRKKKNWFLVFTVKSLQDNISC